MMTYFSSSKNALHNTHDLLIISYFWDQTFLTFGTSLKKWVSDWLTILFLVWWSTTHCAATWGCARRCAPHPGGRGHHGGRTLGPGLLRWHNPPGSLGETLQYQGSHKKRGLLMEIFHKGSDPPPLIFGSYGTGATHLILVTKKGKNKTFQKHLKWPYLKELFCKKCIKVMEPPSPPPFSPKIP